MSEELFIMESMKTGIVDIEKQGRHKRIRISLTHGEACYLLEVIDDWIYSMEVNDTTGWAGPIRLSRSLSTKIEDLVCPRDKK